MMSAGERELPDESAPQNRIDNILIGGDEFVVYDRKRAPAWIQSDTIVEVNR